MDRSQAAALAEVAGGGLRPSTNGGWRGVICQKSGVGKLLGPLADARGSPGPASGTRLARREPPAHGEVAARSGAGWAELGGAEHAHHAVGEAAHTRVHLVGGQQIERGVAAAID